MLKSIIDYIKKYWSMMLFSFVIACLLTVICIVIFLGAIHFVLFFPYTLPIFIFGWLNYGAFKALKEYQDEKDRNEENN